MDSKSASEIESYVTTNSSFIDYARFEDDAKAREAVKQEFIDGLVHAPEYEYPKLDRLHDVDAKGSLLSDKKRETYEAVLELEANKLSGVMSSVEHELYAGFHEQRLKKILLVEAASRMRHADSSASQLVARQEFMSLNREVYGEMDEQAFVGMMTTEQQRTQEFVPVGSRAESIKHSLQSYFAMHHYDREELPLLNHDVLTGLQTLVDERYDNVLQVVPDTDDTVFYEAAQCHEILTAALQAGGLADKGWKIEVSHIKSNPATNVDGKKIYIPSSIRRNAAQLRRLIIHEQEVHARRGQNGAESGMVLLEKGTAEYADVEEGLGVLLECIIAGDFDNQSYHRARDRYITAGVALGLDGNPKDARATFGLLWRLIALRMADNGEIKEKIEHDAKAMAMLHIENAYRGTNFAMPGVIYTKLKVYYEGLAKNAAFFEERRDDLPAALDDALIGKFNHVSQTESDNVYQALTLRQHQQTV
jgi:hypothetical protein